MWRKPAVLLAVVLLASTCGPDDLLPQVTPQFDDNPRFGLDGRDPIAALACPFVEIDLPGDLVLGPGSDGFPDLVITAHESAVLSDNAVIHFLDNGDTSSYTAAGGWSLPETTLAPGEEIELVLDAGTGLPDDGFDYPDFNYAIGTLHTTTVTDANPANNVSVSPLIPAP